MGNIFIKEKKIVAKKVSPFKRILSNVVDNNKVPYLYRVLVKDPLGVLV